MRNCCITQGTLLHFAVQQKLTQHCKTTIPQLKKKKTLRLRTLQNTATKGQRQDLNPLLFLPSIFLQRKALIGPVCHRPMPLLARAPGHLIGCFSKHMAGSFGRSNPCQGTMVTWQGHLITNMVTQAPGIAQDHFSKKAASIILGWNAT